MPRQRWNFEHVNPKTSKGRETESYRIADDLPRRRHYPCDRADVIWLEADLGSDCQ